MTTTEAPQPDETAVLALLRFAYRVDAPLETLRGAVDNLTRRGLSRADALRAVQEFTISLFPARDGTTYEEPRR
ncbi:MAG: hypothetical protein U1E62_26585 [Alsobacter sp.]